MKRIWESHLGARIGAAIGLACILAGALGALRQATVGASLLIVGTLLLSLSMEAAIQRILQIDVWRLRIGSWLALLSIVGGGLATLRNVSTGALFVLFGLLISIAVRKPVDTPHDLQ